MPDPAAVILAGPGRGPARGHLLVESGDLRRLIGRPTTSLHDALAAALRDTQ